MAEAVSLTNNRQKSLFANLFDLVKKFVFPLLLAALILFTSGHARTTSRQGNFNQFTLYILLAFTLVFVVLFIVKTPTKFYRSFLHPIRDKIYKNKLIYTVLIPIIALAAFAIYYQKTNDIMTVGHYLL